MLKNVKGSEVEMGGINRRKNPSSPIYGYKVIKPSFFDCNILHDMPIQGWEYLARQENSTVFRVLKESLGHLLANTHNSERPFDKYGFAGGALDGRGFSRFDYGNACAYWEHLRLYPTDPDGTYIKSMVLLLVKYRKQLMRHGIDYPRALFLE